MPSVITLRENLAKLSDSDRAFAQSLLDQAEGRGLSQKQSAWVDRLVRKANAPKPPPIDISGLLDFLNQANVKRPVLVLRAGETDIRLSIAGPASRTPGFAVVTSPDNSFANRKFYGRISPEGIFEPALSLEPETQSAIVVALQAMAVDPAGTAARYGKLMGCCCFCRLPLTDARSVEVGYGKICSRKYNLPWA